MRILSVLLLLLLALSLASPSVVAQEDTPADERRRDGIAERIGAQIDRSLERFKGDLQEGWAELRSAIDRLSVEGRVYSRLRWDKEIDVDRLDIEVEGRDTVLLTGSVPDEQGKRKAVQLAEDTVGVREVIDRLEVLPPPAE